MLRTVTTQLERNGSLNETDIIAVGRKTKVAAVVTVPGRLMAVLSQDSVVVDELRPIRVQLIASKGIGLMKVLIERIQNRIAHLMHLIPKKNIITPFKTREEVFRSVRLNLTAFRDCNLHSHK